MKTRFLKHTNLLTVSLLIALGGCSALRPTESTAPSFNTLDNAHSLAPASQPAPQGTPTLMVSPPRAAAGFDSQHIVYVRTPHKLEYYAQREWIDAPSRMIAPLIVDALERKSTFRAVMLTPSTASADLRLDTEIIRLQHDVSSLPSQVRFTLRASLVDNSNRQILAQQEFDASVTTPSEGPDSGIVAANQAVQNVLEQLAEFCSKMALKKPMR